MKLDEAIGEVQRAERDLAAEFRKVGERHTAEPDVYHLSRTLARKCEEHVGRLEPFAARYGTAAVDAAAIADSPAPADPALLLLRDLRDLYLHAQAAELAWVMLVQAARAARDPDLLLVAGEIQEEAETRWKWLRTRIKETAPQVFVAG